MNASRASRVPAWVWFLAWMLDGALLALAMLGALTIGVFVLPVAIVVTMLLATRRGSSAGATGVISGASLPAFYVAYLNRDGPGTICRSFAGGQSCTEEWSPVPWLIIGLVLLLGGVGLCVVDHRNRRARRSIVEPTG